MTLAEAVARVRAAPDDAGAWAVVRAELDRLSRRVTADEDLRREAVEAVRARFEDQALSGDLDEILAPAAWFSKALRWRVYDAERRRRRREEAARRAATRDATRIRAPEPEPIGANTVALLEEVFAKALSMRDPWQRAHLELAWTEIMALHLEAAPLTELVRQTRDAGDVESVRRAVQVAHKAHQRCRAALLAALDRLEAAGRIDPESAAAARHALTRLRRRQQAAAPDVSAPEEPDDG